MASVGVLGPLEVRASSGVLVPITSLRQRRLLLALVQRTGEVVEAGELVDLVWRHDIPVDAAGGLYSVVSRLRRRLPPPLAILTEPRGYRLTVDAPDRIDILRFGNIVDDAQTERDPARRLRLLDEAVALVRGRPYAELDHPVVAADVARFTELELIAHELRARALLDLGRPSAAAIGLQALVIRAPLSERPVALLMRALVDSGRQSDALRAYRRLRTDLVEQLGIEPSAELRRLEESVLHQRPTVDDTTVAHRAQGHAAVISLADAAAELVGRADDVERLVAALARARLVTLTGVGGVGKSRLATAVVECTSTAHADGVLVCELARLGPGGDVAAAVATALAVQPSAGRTIGADVADALHRRDLLLVLDNCEHVLDGVAELVAELAARCPRVTVLATSREPLRVPTERVFRVDPLLRSDGVRLFRDRAGSARPDVALPDDEVLATLCARLDCLPLAIELAAATIGSLTPLDLLEGLDDPVTLLHRDARGRAPRHRNLASMVAWSHRLLDPDERTLFDRLSVFNGSFDLAAAIPVGAIEAAGRERIRALLTSLVDKSMLNVDVTGSRTRYRMLDTLRHYGVAQLVAGDELEAARQRHLAWFVDVAEHTRRDYIGTSNGSAHETFTIEWDNFRTAVDWAISAHDVASADRLLRGAFCFAWYNLRHELGRWAEDVVALGTVDPTTAGIAAAFRCKQLDPERTIELAELGLAMPSTSHTDGIGLCLFALADAHWHSGDPSRAWAIARQADAAVDDGDDPAMVTAAVSEAAYVGAMHDPPAAQPYLERLRQLAMHSIDPSAGYCFELGSSMRALWEHRRRDAEQHVRRALDIADTMGTPLHLGVARQVLAAVAVSTRAPDADQTIAWVLAYLHEIQDSGASGMLESLAIRWAMTGRLEEAAVLLGHLERHRIHESPNVAHRPAATARIAASPECAERLRFGASLDRDQIVQFTVAMLSPTVPR